MSHAVSWVPAAYVKNILILMHSDCTVLVTYSVMGVSTHLQREMSVKCVGVKGASRSVHHTETVAHVFADWWSDWWSAVYMQFTEGA